VRGRPGVTLDSRVTPWLSKNRVFATANPDFAEINLTSSEDYPRDKPGAKLETSKMAHFDYFDDNSLIYLAV